MRRFTGSKLSSKQINSYKLTRSTKVLSTSQNLKMYTVPVIGVIVFLASLTSHLTVDKLSYIIIFSTQNNS